MIDTQYAFRADEAAATVLSHKPNSVQRIANNLITHSATFEALAPSCKGQVICIYIDYFINLLAQRLCPIHYSQIMMRLGIRSLFLI